MNATIQWSPKHGLFYFQRGGSCRMMNMMQLWNLGVTEWHFKKAFDSGEEINIGRTET